MNQQEEPLAKVITPEKIDYEAQGLVQCEGVVYTVQGGREYKMDIVYPAGVEGVLPTVVWVHGGGWSDEKLTRKYLPSVEMAELSGRGYTTVSIDYRLSQDAPFPAQVEDCKAAVRFLRANSQKYHADPERIAAWGESAGGHLAEMMAYSTEEEFRNSCYSSFSGKLQAVIPWYAPDDLRMDEEKWNGQEIYKRLFPINEKEERLKLMEMASPIVYAGRKNPPTLLMHGEADRLVSPECSKKMYKALKEAGNDVELILIPGQGHGFFEGKEYYDRIFSFLDEKLLSAITTPAYSG